MLSDWLVTEEVLTVQATAQLFEEAQHIAHTVHHRQAQQVLLPIKRGWRHTAESVSRLYQLPYSPTMYNISYDCNQKAKLVDVNMENNSNLHKNVGWDYSNDIWFLHYSISTDQNINVFNRTFVYFYLLKVKLICMVRNVVK